MTLVKLVKVGMADLNVLNGQTGVLKTTGLGSCVGLTLYDPRVKVGGMAHVMLPSSEIAREGHINIAKYADQAIPELIRRMIEQGAATNRLQAKMAGGAQMFFLMVNNDTMRIGPRNVESCREILRQYSIPIKAEDTGGSYGRTIELHCATGKLIIRSVLQGIKEV